MYRRARSQIRDGRELGQAERMLRRAYAIDPTCEAGYWLAVLHEKNGDVDAAIEQYRRYLEVDATMLDAWTAAIRLEERRGATAPAVELAQRGAVFFEREMQLQRPKFDSTVGERYNRKAREAYAAYRDGARELRATVARLTVDRPS